ncbi:zf-HC2 domain-containing protein [Pseudomonas cavernae]|uniref:Zf-HC2 domain-containing protein n=1 Tax=Pseudomonas cavernae TaxID=2320867 RepID=A0A385Z6T9_9PSED|nr:zf-HC2 domain-containing protein [Pseudomonas cavernae]AYC33777.1 zf-HC2 domain-containing protein [Pseudomonas cavernae]
MLSCKELVAHSSDYLDAQLRLRERISVRAHLALCWRCRRFLRQMRVTQGVLRRLPEAAIPELEALTARLAELRKQNS